SSCNSSRWVFARPQFLQWFAPGQHARKRHYAAGRPTSASARKSQEDLARLFKHTVFPPKPMFAHILSVVRRVNDNRVFGYVGMHTESGEYLPHLVVHPIGESVIEFTSTANRIVR